MIGLPEGYTEHDGGECPLEPYVYVDCIIRTSEGLGHSGAVRAELHDWIHVNHEGGVGAVMGYRIAHRGDAVDLRARWSER